MAGEMTLPRRIAVLLLVVLAGLGGCAAPGPAAAPRPAAGLPAAEPAPGFRLPLDDYLPSPAEAAELSQGYRDLLRRCMARFGLDYPPPGPAGGGPTVRNERRYGLVDPAAAAIRGYRFATGLPTRRPPPALSAAGRTALEGSAARVAGLAVPAGGCAAQARRELTAADPPGADTGLAEALSVRGFTAAERDPRVVAAMRAWSGCMGGRYASPFEPTFTGPVTPAETATAVADVACKRQTGLARTWYAVESAAQGPLIGTNAAALRLAGAALRAELALARQAAADR
jgi:hypothetical protein